MFSLDGDIVKVIVGSEPPAVFNVHEALICEGSDYFKTIMSGGWRESGERSVTLKEDDPQVFHTYVHWLYRKTLPVKSDQTQPLTEADQCLLAEAYVLGDRIQDGNFQDAVINAIISFATTEEGNSLPPVSVIKEIYENTPESSKARALLVDLAMDCELADWQAEAADTLPKDFLKDLALEFIKRKPKQNKKRSRELVGDPCKYHQHHPGLSTCNEKRTNDANNTPQAQARRPIPASAPWVHWDSD